MSASKPRSNRRIAVVLAGTGCVAGAWPPVYRAVRASISPDLPDDADLANVEMARLVHLLRIQHGRPSRAAPLLKGLADLRNAIAAELADAETRGDLVVRPHFLQMLGRLRTQGFKTHVITTNWDLSLDRAVEASGLGISVQHLHGSTDDAATLYLPTEICVEQYRRAASARHAKQFLEATRTVAGATDLFVYGLSLSPLDAEVCQVLWGGRVDAPRLRGAMVVDVHPDPVARRLALVVTAAKLPPSGIVQRTHSEPW